MKYPSIKLLQVQKLATINSKVRTLLPFCHNFTEHSMISRKVSPLHTTKQKLLNL